MARWKRTRRLARAVRGQPAGARAVMGAFRLARFSAPTFVSACGVFPEVSESASDQLHAIVNEVATRRLNKARHIRALQQKLRRLATAAGPRHRAGDLMERITSDLTALLAAEATAAYLFGVSVGMSLRTLPDRIDR